MHLTEKQLSEYINCKLSPAELLLIDDHLADCADCCKKLSSVLQANTGGYGAVNFLAGELTASEEDSHLSFTQIVAYLDAQLDAPAQQTIAEHVEFCPACQTEIEDLRAFRQTLSLPNNPTPAAPPTWWERIRVQRAWWAWPTAAAVCLALLILGFYGRKSPEQIAQQPKAVLPTPMPSAEMPIVSATPLATEKSPAVLSAEDRIVQLALTSGRLEIPAEVKRLRGKGGNLLSGKSDDATFVVMAPQGVMVETDQPRLRWSSLSGAKHYIVTITDQNFNEVAQSPALTATDWVAPIKLKRGALYQWQVTATTADGKEQTAPLPSAPEARFQVLSNESLNMIRRARQQYASTPLALGVIYARAGLLTEAARELQTASKQSVVARRLLQQVQAP